MPRKARLRADVECVAHGTRCALVGGGRTYRSARCLPAADVPRPLRQEVELRELLEDLRRSEVAEREGITVEQVVEREVAAREAERQRRGRLSLRALDAELDAADRELAELIAQAEARNVAELAKIMSETA